MHRTRVKICGLTRPDQARAAAALGADAIGLVFYPPSPRHLDWEQARQVAAAVAPFVTVVGLFVNAEPATVREALREVPQLQLLQFHGEEDEAYCRAFGRPYIKAARVRPELDLIEYALSFPTAQGLVLDAFVEGYGGGGQTFDWSLIPARLPLPIILSGGLDPQNVAQAVRALRPWAVDVSSGVEAAKGIKDERKMAAFIAGVRDGES
ncbi:MAG: phosphoribosylanthranilate isomerase [Pseudomonadota bacterium]|jgi:phosphoribosylanthranilate isomerase